jgi:hypothetical protein
MEAKTSQLQIRVSPGEKATLKRLAASAGLSVSAYVLSRVLPEAREGVTRRVRALEGLHEVDKPLSDLLLYLSQLSAEEFEAAVAHVELDGLTPLQQNYAAAAVEREASKRDQPPPTWTEDVPPLAHPHFAWGLRALRPHLLRITHPAFKRRGVYHALPADPRR